MGLLKKMSSKDKDSAKEDKGESHKNVSDKTSLRKSGRLQIKEEKDVENPIKEKEKGDGKKNKPKEKEEKKNKPKEKEEKIKIKKEKIDINEKEMSKESTENTGADIPAAS